MGASLHEHWINEDILKEADAESFVVIMRIRRWRGLAMWTEEQKGTHKSCHWDGDVCKTSERDAHVLMTGPGKEMFTGIADKGRKKTGQKKWKRLCNNPLSYRAMVQRWDRLEKQGVVIITCTKCHSFLEHQYS